MSKLQKLDRRENSLSLEPQTNLDQSTSNGAAQREQAFEICLPTYPAEKCLHELFEEQAERTPDAVALVFEGQQLTYRELNERANWLGHHLRGLGVGPEVLVGLCLERSLELVVGILGILKAGGAYVPLDPAYPSERLAFMLEDSGVRVLVTQEAQGLRLNMPQVAVVLLDNNFVSKTGTKSEPVSSGVRPQHPVYVIYTSGSTGLPKGVLVTHANVVRLLAATQEWFHFEPTDVWTLFHSVSFDFSVWELWGALRYGGRLVVVPYLVSRSAESFYQLLQDQKVTVLNQTPSAFHQLNEVEEVLSKQPSLSLRLVIFGGELLDFSSLRSWVVRHVNRAPQLVNMYGITETTVHVTYRPVTDTDVETTNGSMIGRPIPDLELLVLDEQLQPVPVGETGELYVGGPGLARGYLNRPELTAERFLTHPFSQRPGARLYKTGDLVRRHQDGDLEYLGRIDNQVKLRGHRIELGEIETLLNQHPSVMHSVVVLREDRPGDQRLVAYCVGKDDVDVCRLTDYLGERLPEYMVPSAVVRLDALPLTINGKVDKRALPAPEQSRPELKNQYVAPRNQIEEKLATIWCEVLGIERVGIHDYFFELGGHSLLAVRAVVRIRQAFQVDMPIRTLFESPTIAALAQFVSAAKRVESAPVTLHQIDRSNSIRFPLSFAQQRLWFLEQMEGELTAYNLPFAWRISGQLNIDALRRAIEEIIRRHEPLRTTIAAFEGEAAQIVKEADRFALPAIDLRGVEENHLAEEVNRYFKAEGEKPFDLAGDLMLRALLLQLSEHEHVLLLTMHHIAADGWSVFVVLMKELKALYQRYSEHVERHLPDLPVQYVDYSHWQRQQLSETILDKLLGYWRKQLDGLTPLELPTDRPRPRQQSYRGRRFELTLDAELIDKLKAIGQSENATLHMSLLAAFMTLMSRYSSQNDVTVGTVTAGRDHAALEGLIGFFVNTLALRIDFSGTPTFRELLLRVRKTSLEAYDHQDLPFEKLVEELQPERHLGRSPLVQVVFQLLNFADPGLKLAGLEVLALPQVDERVRFDLEMYVWQPANNQDDYRATIVYATDLFDASTIERLAGHFVTLLKSIVTAPDQPVSTLPILTEAERHQLLVEWNDTAAPYPHDRCVHQLFEEQVERTPDAVAIVFENQQLTYRELNHRANQIAKRLMQLGVRPEMLVGLCLDRSLELIIGILGVLKAGGAYLPLDSSLPAQRLEFMIRDSALAYLVTQRVLLYKLPTTIEYTVLLEPHESVGGDFAIENLESGVGPRSLVYTMYTSGSTGNPKGVQIVHSSVVNLLSAMAVQPGLLPKDLLLSVTTPSFDISVLELLLPLTVGARVEVVKSEVTSDASSLAARLFDSTATVMQATPSTWQMLIDNGWDGCQNLKVLCGGESLPNSLVNELSSRCDELWNMYGPTETTIWSMVVRVTGSTFSGSIGRPIANTQAYVLDNHRQPVPIGMPGELYIGGAGLARGYLNRPELTAEKFVLNPFSSDPDTRLYRTGDLCRWRVDGNLEFLGRLDNQIKLRGFRIELGEIETKLNQHPSVAHSIVILREDRPGDKYLVAYCISAVGAVFEDIDLARHLRTHLPEYMIPSAFVRLQVFPLTPSGKINRHALPVPDKMRPDRKDPYNAPRNPLEEQLASIWSQVLGVERVGIHDNFFDLGGHSLLAVQVTAWVAAALEVALPIRKLFDTPTIAELAIVIKLLQSSSVPSPARPLVQIDREEFKRLPLSFAQKRLWFLEQMEGELTAYNLPFSWRIRGKLNTEALRRALEAIIRRHEPLRTTFSAIEGEPFQLIGKIDRFELPVEDLCGLETDQQSAEIERYRSAEAERPFDLTHDLMLRGSLLQLGENEHVLLLTTHHIAFDGWSVRVFWRELKSLYASFSNDLQFDLPDLPVQYADFAFWQRSWLQGEVLDQHLAYWKEHLAGAPLVLTLPTDFPRPSVQRYRGAQYEFMLDRYLSKALQELSRREGVTLFITMLAAWQTLLMRYSGQEDLVIGVPSAGRSNAQVDGLIGFFVNTLALRTDLSGNPSFNELLQRVKKSALGAFTHQDVPFEKLVEELDPARSLSHSPIVQFLFVLHNMPSLDWTLGELNVSPIEGMTTTAKFDLTLSLHQETAGLRGSLAFNTDLFEAETIARLANHIVVLLKGIVADPAQLVGEYPILLESERKELLTRAQSNNSSINNDILLHRLFENQVERTPDAIAILYEDQRLTYRELNLRANALARQLMAHGVGPEAFVGLVADGTPAMIVGLLGILKAGGAYVPLDPDLPSTRQQFIIDDAGVSVIVTTTVGFTSLTGGCLLVSADASAHAIESELASPETTVNETCPVYLLYTSGSTGQPKGVIVEHRHLANYVQAVVTAYGLEAGGQFAMLQPLSVDSTQIALFPVLGWGGTIHMISRERSLDAVSLADWLEHHPADFLKIAPSHLAALLTVSRAERLLPAKALILGGESLHWSLVARLTELQPKCSIWNHYGPTETTVGVLTYPVNLAGDKYGQHCATVPVGRPLANCTCYILDKRGELVPRGVVGELYIGGRGVSRGYLKRPDLTDERFLADPFVITPGARIYRTGDFVRLLPGGEIEFLGRKDGQVKIRGMRIEIGEIEATLLKHPEIAESVVVLQSSPVGDPQLVAYIVPNRKCHPSSECLRSFLSERLPEAMRPVAFLIVDTLPRTPHGKLDRKALPPVMPAAIGHSTNDLLPRTPLEEQLTKIWCDLLGLKQVGIHENFFDLGGHSLLAVRLFARIESSLGRKLPLAVLFQHGTISHIAKLLANSSPPTEVATAIPLQIGEEGGTLFLLPSITGEALFSKAMIDVLGKRFSVIGIQPALVPQNTEHFRDFRTTARHYVNALRSYQPHGPYALAGFSYGGMMAFEVACLLVEVGEKVNLLAVIDTGPGNRGVKPRFNHHVRKLSRILFNLPYWLREEYQQFSMKGLINRTARKLRRFVRYVVSGGHAGVKIDDVFDIDKIPHQSRELMRAVFAACRSYQPHYYPGKLTLFRAKVRPLLSGCSKDLGWGRFAGSVDVHHLNGDHETILQSPNIDELNRILADLLDQLRESR